MPGKKISVSPKTQKKFIKGFWITGICVILFILFLFLSISVGIFGKMPSFEELENPKSNLATEIYSSDHETLGKYYIENRSNIHYRELSSNVINALIATEDSRFNEHSGVDIKAIFRVLFGMITGTNRGGGSTISQQLAKNLFPRKKDRNFFETAIIKFKEWGTAIKLERDYSKDEILAMYMNTVDFGSQAFGIESAAKTYFNKEPKDLKAEEAALLIGILKAPSWFSPVRNPQRAVERRNTVLRQMKKYDYLTGQQYDSLKALPMDMTHYQIQDHTAGLATYFREYLRGVLSDWCANHQKEDGTPYNLYRDGLKIYTTINSRMQQYAEEAVREYLGKELQPSFFRHWKGIKDAPFVFDKDKTKEIQSLMMQAMRRSERYFHLKTRNVPDAEILRNFNTRVKMTVFSWKGDIDTVLTPMDSIRYYKFLLQSGVMSVDPHTGFVKAYVGGIDYRYFQYDHVKFAKRQVGSTFKPFLYTLAMQEGDQPCTLYPNVQPVIELSNGDIWAPRNDSKERLGEDVTLKWALAYSNNWISGQLMKKYSPQDVIKIARKMGMTSDIPAVYSIALGSADLTLYEMTGAMGTFANKGVYVEPIFVTRIEDKNGNVLEAFLPKQQEAISEKTAYMMIMLMKGVVESGTGTRLVTKYGFTNPIAGKTGTSQNQSDGWFMGITPDLVTGVWTGCDDRSAHFRTLDLGQGANTALPIWAYYMRKVYADPNLHISQRDFDLPSEPINVEFDCDKYQGPKKKKKVNIDDF
jgi:penicillin-binding protein 1A